MLRRKGTQLAIVAAAALVSGCPSGEDQGDTDGGGGGSTGTPEMELPGVRLNCCYTLGVLTPGSAPAYDQGCIATETAQPCVDPTEWGNLDGEISNTEAASICALKCPSSGSFQGGPFLDEDGYALEIQGPFDVCTVAYGEVSQVMAMACNPDNPSHTAPWSDGPPPTHEGTLSSTNAGSSAEVEINGVLHAADFVGEILLGISDCETRSRQEVCVLDLQSLALELESTPTFGNYEVDTAQIRLNLPARTTTSFVCDTAGCSGSFDFLARTGTSVEADVAWDQTNLQTSAVGGGSLALGRKKLGHLSRVTGELELDSTKTTGTIRIWGTGEDHFGGEAARVTFDLRGSVSRYAP